MGAHDISPSGPIPSWLLTFLAQQKPLPLPRALPARRQLSPPLHIDGKSGRRDLSLLPPLKRRQPGAPPAARPAFQTTQWRVTLEQVLQLDDISRL